MGLESGLVTYLGARAGLTAIIDTRIFPQLVPQGANNYPAVTFQTISESNTHSLSGVSGLAMSRLQITCWGRTVLDALRVRDAVVDALDGYRGLMGSTTVQSCLKLDERDMPATANASPELAAARVYGRGIDFMFSYTEPVPSYA